MNISHEFDSKNKKIALASSLLMALVAFIILHVLSFKIPTPPLPEALLYKDAEMEFIALEDIIPDNIGSGGGGSGTPVDAKVINKFTPQTENVVRDNTSNTSVVSGNSNHSNTTKPTTNSSTTTTASNNPFGNGGSGGGTQGGNGTGIGNDDGNGNGPGNGNGSGGNVKRFLVSKPSTSTISSDEDCKIVLSVLVDENGNIVGNPQFIRAKSTSNNTQLINQIIYLVKTQAKFNKAPGASNGKEVITLDVKAN